MYIHKTSTLYRTWTDKKKAIFEGEKSHFFFRSDVMAIQSIFGGQQQFIDDLIMETKENIRSVYDGFFFLLFLVENVGLFKNHYFPPQNKNKLHKHDERSIRQWKSIPINLNISHQASKQMKKLKRKFYIILTTDRKKK